MNSLSVECWWCRAKPGAPCIKVGTLPFIMTKDLRYVHACRARDAAQADKEKKR